MELFLNDWGIYINYHEQNGDHAHTDTKRQHYYHSCFPSIMQLVLYIIWNVQNQLLHEHWAHKWPNLTCSCRVSDTCPIPLLATNFIIIRVNLWCLSFRGLNYAGSAPSCILLNTRVVHSLRLVSTYSTSNVFSSTIVTKHGSLLWAFSFHIVFVFVFLYRTVTTCFHFKFNGHSHKHKKREKAQ